MRKLGLLGGMSWESTALYYAALNRGVRARRGGLSSAPLLLHSFDFAPIAAMQARGDWDGLGRLMASGAAGLAAQGADALVLCTNTMHKVCAEIERAAPVPLLHIADATGLALRRAGVRRPLLLATRFTMEEPFLTERLAVHGAMPVVPDGPGRTLVHTIIYEELCRGVVEPGSKARVLALVASHARRGCDGIILGCTELGLLLAQEDVSLPLFDTTMLHVEAALDFACAA
ncbi:aspartate/glutamate racemase family protein [Salinarimonas ramus]|uniref:Aspartate racemase n=1 Tax=Salinarimonas ramus TaxID=690164 RepID=A0A917Q3B9_9HYPH|nr:aspartate/glutamate racemase family protein [Salinarimonas ramus]GGK17871.1 aspartate racemase [Salinarimonas ramus]